MITARSTFLVFLSAVSHEFGLHRMMLKADLSFPSVEMREQADLVQGGGKLLQTLEDRTITEAYCCHPCRELAVDADTALGGI